MATLTENIKSSVRSTLDSYARHIVDTVAPPTSVTARSFLSNQLSVKMLEHMQWLINSNYILPDRYVSGSKRFTLMGETEDDENYSITLRESSPELADSKAYAMVGKFELSPLATRVYCEHPDWAVLYAWRDACDKQAYEYRQMMSLMATNLLYINTTGQLNRCLPILTSLLPSKREQASRGAKVRSPMPPNLRGNEPELYRLNRDIGVMLAKYKLTRDMPTQLWIAG